MGREPSRTNTSDRLLYRAVDGPKYAAKRIPRLTPAGPPWKQGNLRTPGGTSPERRVNQLIDDRPDSDGAEVSSPAPPTDGGVSSAVRNLRWALRSRIAESPGLYLPLARLKYRRPGPSVVDAQTALVIDGYTRSAITFAVFAFQLAQDRPVRLAHHLHAPAQLIEAVRRGVPTLAVIREPEGAVLSAMIREPYLTARTALVAYSRFHHRLLPYRQGLVVGEFEAVTSDLGAVIRTVNGRFGTRFREFEHTSENVRACFNLVEVRARRPAWDHVLGSFECGLIGVGELRRALADHRVDQESPLGAAGVERAARPSIEREGLKQGMRNQFHRPELKELRVQAQRAYERFLVG
jgi:hypothetical protein